MTACLSSIEKQQAILLAAIGEEVHRGSRFALLDHPNHDNIGDSVIWSGEIAALKAITGRLPTYAAGMTDYDQNRFVNTMPRGTIFLHGGGNFGDLYPDFHAFKLDVLEAFRGRRIVQMPQSIHFKDASGVAATAAAIRTHGNFRFLARDQVTYDFAASAFDCEVSLVPDAAFGLGPLSRSRLPSMPLLQFRRRDQESQTAGVAGSVDWPAEDEKQIHAIRWPSKLTSLKSGRWTKTSRQVAALTALADHRVRVGVDLLSHGEKIICDRLHVHILSVLLGIPHVFIDNSTRKISAYNQTWTYDCPLAHYAANEAEAQRIAESL